MEMHFSYVETSLCAKVNIFFLEISGWKQDRNRAGRKYDRNEYVNESHAFQKRFSFGFF